MAEKMQMKARTRGQALNAAVAALAALSVAFFIFAMPAEIFRAVAGATGIGSRAVAMAGAAALTFALVNVLLRALDRLPRKSRGAAIEVPAEPPRLRRADAHPDAPARVPVFARHELGDPLPVEQPEPVQNEPAGAEPVEPAAEAHECEASEEDVLELDQPLTGLLAGPLDVSDGEPVEREPAIEAPEQPLPGFIALEPAEEAAVEPEPAAFEQANEGEEPSAFETAASAEAIDAGTPAEAAEIEGAAIEGATEEASVPVEEAPGAIEDEADPVAETVADELPVDEPALAAPSLVSEDDPAVAAVDEAPRAEAIEPMPPVGDKEPVAEYKPVSAPAPIAEPIEQLAARLPEVPQPREEKISDLMGRLEIGLARSDRARWLGQSEDDPAEMPTDDRLKSAIGKLRRMAGRG